MYLLVDIGGTNTRIAIAADSESFGESKSFATPRKYHDGIEQILSSAQLLVGDDRVDGIVVGAAGPLNQEKSQLLNAPNLPDWVGKPLVADISRAFGVQTLLFNDADLVGLGEAHFGAGRGYSIVAYLTISTGVGGTRIVDGQVDQYTLGFEPGHQLLDMEHSFEDLAGGTSIFRTYGKHPEELDDPSIWKEQAQIIAVGVHNTIVMWSPDVVILGGSQMKKLSIDEIQKEATRLLHIFPHAPEIRVGHLDSEGGLWGALAVIQKEFVVG